LSARVIFEFGERVGAACGRSSASIQPETEMTRRRLILVLATTSALTGLAVTAVRARDVPKVATGFVANVLCSETFVSGLDPEKNFAETVAAMPGVWLIRWALDFQVDRARKDVTVSLLGLGRSRAAYRGALGCFLDHGDTGVDIEMPPVGKPQ